MPSHIHITPAYAAELRELQLDAAERIFRDPRLRVWRDLEDRDNSTLDATLNDGRKIRLHVKRDKKRRREPMALEAAGITLLNQSGIDSAPLVAHGNVDERTFVITENLDGYLSADRLMETSVDRLPVLQAMIDVAAKLHNAGLHHRDLYANHFYMRPVEDGYTVRLIDTARVRKLPWLLAERWIVKDVAQFVFSIGEYVAKTDHVEELMARYAVHTSREIGSSFFTRVAKKAAWIARHDEALRAKKPRRNLRLQDGN